MALTGSLKREERIGLGIAAGLHVALVLAFLVQPKTRDDIQPAQRMTVNLTDEVGVQAAAPEPVAESRAAVAPTLSDEPAPAAPAPIPAEVTPRPQPTIQPRLAPPVAPKRPAPAEPRPRSRPDARKAAPAPSPVPAKAGAAPAKPAPKAGGNRLGDNFLAGMGDSTRTSETRAAASSIGAREKASLLQAIIREVRPKWQPPSGPDVDQITTFIRFRLNSDGSLSGRPTVVRQTGVNETNRAQAGRHEELAIRAVQLAAPFDLPEKYYEAWKVVGPLGFNLELAQ